MVLKDAGVATVQRFMYNIPSGTNLYPFLGKKKGAERISGAGLQSRLRATEEAAAKRHAVNQGSDPREEGGRFLKEGELGDIWRKGKGRRVEE